MRRIKLFWRETCPLCPRAKTVAESLMDDGYPVEFFNLSSVDGLAEGAFHSVLAAPTMLLVEEHDYNLDTVTLAEWRGVIPDLEEVKREYSLTL